MTGRPDPSRAVLARDAALARVGRARRWVIAGTAALAAGFAALVSAVAPGKTLKTTGRAEAATATRSASSHSRSSAIPAMPPAAAAGDLGLQGPDQAPSAAPQPQSIPSQPPAPSSPPSSSSGGGGGVVSGGS